MAVVVKHKKTATFADQPGVEINKGEWNDSHDITGLAAVATSGAYADLSGLPTLGTLAALNAVSLTANVTGILPWANGGTNNNATPGAGQLIYSDASKYVADANLTWSATTGLKTLKGISSPNAVGSQMFGPNITDAATTNPSQNTLVGDGANNPYTYVFGITAIGYNATVSGNNGTAIGAGATAAASTCVAIGNGTSCSASNAVNVGPGNQLTAGLLALGSSNIIQHSNAGGLGTTGVTTQAGELFWGNADGSGATNIPASFRLFGTGGSPYVGLNLWRVNPTFIDPTNATFKVRTVFSTYDAGGEREYMRADATGSGVNAFIKDKLRVGDVTTTATAVVHLSAGTSAAATAPLKFTVPGVPLTTPEAGVMETDAERIYYTPTSLIRCCLVGTIFTQTADKTVSNTVTETSVVGTGVGYGLTLPANFFVVGKTVRLRIGGIYSTPAIATPSVIVKVKYGSVVLATVTTSSLLSGASGLEFDGEIDITCRSTGGSGTVAMHGDIEYATGVAGTIAVDPLNNGGAVKTIDTTAASLIDITVQWDTATTTRIATSTVFTAEVLN